MTDTPIRLWETMTTTDVRDLAASDPVVILPLAAIEQHGPHLPLSTDLEIGMGLLAAAFRNLPDDVGAWVLPPLTVGASREHERWPGTVSLDHELLAAVIYRHGVALAQCGVRRLVLSNSHGGNRAVMDQAGLRLRAEHRLLVVKASYFRFTPPDDVNLPTDEWRHGLHGGAVETAMMLHLRPDLVRRDRVQNSRSLGHDLEGTLSRLGPEGQAPFSWLADDLSRTGVTGDARLADAAMGRRLVEHYGEALGEVIREAQAFPLERLS